MADSLAEAISRNRLDMRFDLCTQVCRKPVKLNLEVVRSLVLESHWTSDTWKVVSRLVKASVAPSTRRTYSSGQRRYFSFCRGAHLSLLPLTEKKACWSLLDFDSIRLWIACCTCYFVLFFEIGEVTVPLLREYDEGLI